MAKSIWLSKADLTAFAEGKEAAEQGKPRIALLRYTTYNERAAFNDGWDSFRSYGPNVSPSRQRTAR